MYKNSKTNDENQRGDQICDKSKYSQMFLWCLRRHPQNIGPEICDDTQRDMQLQVRLERNFVL